MVRLFVISSMQVVNDHMSPTLLPGDYAVAYRLPFGIRIPLSGSKIGKGKPSRGDVVMFPCPGDARSSCVRRVMGLSGDRVEIQGERLILNGEMAEYSSPEEHRSGLLLTESVLGMSHQIAIAGQEANRSFGPVIVGPGHVFLLSDHRDLSKDSRSYGAVPVASLEARISMVWVSWSWPKEARSALPALRWGRVLKAVQ